MRGTKHVIIGTKNRSEYCVDAELAAGRSLHCGELLWWHYKIYNSTLK